MNVYLSDLGCLHLLGSATLPEDYCGAYEAPVCGSANAIIERFAIGTIIRLPADGGTPVVERAVLASPGQIVELLPGWEPLAS
jgi:hypothetical protein